VFSRSVRTLERKITRNKGKITFCSDISRSSEHCSSDTGPPVIGTCVINPFEDFLLRKGTHAEMRMNVPTVVLSSEIPPHIVKTLTTSTHLPLS